MQVMFELLGRRSEMDLGSGCGSGKALTQLASAILKNVI